MARPNMSRYKYTPASTESMTTGQMRRAYSYLRSVINKRAARVAAKGYSEFEYGKPIKRGSAISDEDIRGALLDASRRARDAETFAGGFENRLDARIRGLHEAGFENVDRSNAKQFFDFMEQREDAFKRGIYDSNITAQLFNMAASKGVSAKTIEREFGQWLTSNQKMEDLYDAIEAFDLPATRKRMSSTEIRRNLQ